MSIDTETIGSLLRNEGIKRDALEGEKAAATGKTVRRAGRQRQRAKPEPTLSDTSRGFCSRHTDDEAAGAD